MVRRLIGFLLFLIAGSAVIGAVVALAFSGTEAGRGPRIVLVVLALVIGIPWLLFRGFRRTWLPVGELMDATNRMGQGQSGVRVTSSNRGPMRMVTQSFNTMAERLDAEEDRRRRLLADLGHELRTPLTVMRGEIEALVDGVRPADSEHLAALLDDVEVMERLLVDLRTLTMAEAGQLELHIEETDLSELVRDVLAGLRGRAGTQDVDIEVAAPQPVMAEVDPVRLREVVLNLAVNALRHMPDGGSLSATVTPDPPTISIADTGRGVPVDQLDSVFDRFVKAADSQGSGLGLTIVKDLVEAHGGTVSASNDEGAVFTVTLKAAPRR
jgi:two-component system sensor histidine kinase BaeS